MAEGRLTTAIFPSAGSVHVYHAVDTGLFADAGLEVEVREVESSDEQMAGWDAGDFDLMHTSPDHLLREGREREPVVVRAEGLGELAVHVREGVPLSEARWGVDGVDSAFAFVLGAILEDVAGVSLEPDDLLAVGGTKQRFESLLVGDIDGTTLHPPFDRIAADRGFVRLGGHLEHLSDLMVVCAVAPRRELGSTPLRRYLEVCDRSADMLLGGGTAAIRVVLERRGLEGVAADAAAAGMAGDAGLRVDPQPSSSGLDAVAALRRRFRPDWTPPRSLESLLATTDDV